MNHAQVVAGAMTFSIKQVMSYYKHNIHDTYILGPIPMADESGCSNNDDEDCYDDTDDDTYYYNYYEEGSGSGDGKGEEDSEESDTKVENKDNDESENWPPWFTEKPVATNNDIDVVDNNELHNNNHQQQPLDEVKPSIPRSGFNHAGRHKLAWGSSLIAIVISLVVFEVL